MFERTRTQYAKHSQILYVLLVACLAGLLPLSPAAVADSPPCDTDDAGQGPAPDGPRLSSPGELLEPSAAAGVKTFKTDQAPELDWYQPCNGGDREIYFDIDVTGVQLAAIQSATLTLAVWDVDFDCGTACGGVCERDTVYVNGHQLTTPVAYLTGANNQWSTVTFNVQPGWIVDGNNRIQIFIDTLSQSCWCVTCDWGELAITESPTPEVEEIEILERFLWIFYLENKNPTTTKDVIFRAKLKNMSGYEEVKVAWSGDIPAGEGNPYTCKPAAGTHGKDKNVTGTLTYRKTGATQTGTHSESKEFSLFFDKRGDEDNDGTHNWYEYWSSARDAACSYNAASAAYVYRGGSYAGSQFAEYNGNVATPTYSIWNRASMNCAYSFSIPGYNFNNMGNGLDCVEASLAHERTHQWVDANWHAGQPDFDADEVPNAWEQANAALGFDSNNPRSFAGFPFGDDEEVYCEMQSLGAAGALANDWANPGKQTNPPSFRRIIDETGTHASFSGSFTDRLMDRDGDTRFDALAIDVGVSVQAAGTYRVFGNLYDSLGQMVWAEAFTSLEPGQRTMPLVFDGATLRQRRVSGPYVLRSVVLFGATFEQEIENAHTTAPYAYTEFAATGSEIGSNVDSSTRDTNGNGLADAMDFAVEVDLVNATDVILDGFVHAPDATVIAYVRSEQTLPAGHHTIILTARGKTIRQGRKDGPYTLKSLSLFERENRVDFIYLAHQTQAYRYTDFEAGDAEFTSITTFSDRGVDLNSDTLFDLLRITVRVQVTQAGQYVLVGRLFDSAGESIDDTLSQVTLNVGQQTVDLDFSGRAIRRHRVNGPYVLRYAFLYEGSGSIADLLPGAYSTAAYDYRAFQRNPVEFTGNYADRGTDTNGDGVYEYLTVDVEVIVATAGSHALNARIMDASGQEIVWAATTATLPADQPRVMQLNFSGPSIFQHGVHGPYYVRDVHVYNVGNPALSDTKYDAYTTGPYRYWNFGRVGPIAEAGGPYHGRPGEAISFDAGGSYDPDGSIVLYEWDWNNDGTYDESTSSPTIAHTWSAEFTGNVRLRVTDNDHLTSTDTAQVIVKAEPQPVLAGIAFSSPVYDRRSGDFQLIATISNESTQTISTPLWLVVMGVTPTTVSPHGTDGTTGLGEPYWDLGSLLGGGSLLPGQSVSKMLRFGNASRVRFTCNLEVRGVVVSTGGAKSLGTATLSWGTAPGDFDADGDVDLADFAAFAACTGGPGLAAANDCATAFDADLDTDVDLADFAAFQAEFGS